MTSRRERLEAIAVEVAKVNHHVEANRLTLDFMIGVDADGNHVAELDSWSLLHDENSLDFDAINDEERS